MELHSMNITIKAKEFATQKHQGQVRKFSSLPYIIHPEAVASLLEEYGFSFLGL